MKKKDSFYSTYRETTDELSKLREAHGILISMIKNHHIQIEDESKIMGTSIQVSPNPSFAVQYKPSRVRRVSDLFNCCGINTSSVNDQVIIAEPPMSRKRNLPPNLGKDVNFLQ